MSGGIHIPDPPFREAVAAIDAGDVRALEALLAAHPRLLRDRADCGDGYFHRPYLLWFVAENPVRNGRLPANVAQVTRTIVQAARREGVETLREQLDYTLALVCSGRIVRKCGAQGELIDLLVDAGADPHGAMLPALAHREAEAAARLLEHGAPLTLTAVVCTGRADDVARLLPAADAVERQTALTAAALYGDAGALSLLVDSGVEVSAYGPEGFHAHATALHHAVDSGSLDAVKVLAEAGADLTVRDRVYQGTPLDWAEHLEHPAIAAYLRERMAGSP
jgi:Ankyrin repeats (3 copies)